jgi:hypothetical protein
LQVIAKSQKRTETRKEEEGAAPFEFNNVYDAARKMLDAGFVRFGFARLLRTFRDADGVVLLL